MEKPMRPVHLVLAERDAALRRVLRTGFALHDFDVRTVPSANAAREAAGDGQAQAALLDAGLLDRHVPEFDPVVTVVLMSDAPLADAPCLWIRKPFDVGLLAAFLRARYERTHLTDDRRQGYREPVSGHADVVVARTCAFYRAELLNLSDAGCALRLPHGAVEGDHLWMRLCAGKWEALLGGIVRNVRLVITPDGELQRAVGVETVRG
jgi:hypothetical protein